MKEPINLSRALLFMFINNTIAYTFIILTMIFGWGLWPENWLIVIVGYALSSLTWPFVTWFAKQFSDALDRKVDE